MKPFKETKVFDILKKVIPGVATDVIGDIPMVGPIAKAIIEQTLGKAALGEIQLTPDEVKELNNQIIEIEKLENDDRANARAREIEIAKAGKKDYAQPILAYTSAALFIFLVVYTLVVGIKNIPKEESLLIGTIIGAVITNYKETHSYFFGSSKGSKDNGETIREIAKGANTVQ